MPVYVSIGAARIQTWLLRTPKLTLMRGASLVLEGIKSQDVVEELNLRGTPAESAPDISGVVTVEFPTMSDAERGLPRLLRHLQQAAPGMEWEGWCLEAADYFQALGAVRRDDAHRRVSLLATLQDFGAIHACGCRREPARPYAGRPRDDEATLERKRLGPDCRARHKAQANERQSDKAGKGLAARIPGDLPNDFDELARQGGLAKGAETPRARGRKESRNHLATIVADGNAIGGLFDAFGAASADGIEGLLSTRTELVLTLKHAIEEAVVAAGQAVSDKNADIKVVTTHYLGGDDLFLSVPAVYAWEFCAVLAKEFEAGLAKAKAAVHQLTAPDEEEAKAVENLARINERMTAVSLGIGICFAHASHPISETHHEAEEAMKAAKKKAAGKASLIGWTDLTVGPVDGGLTRSGVVATEVIQKELAPPPEGGEPNLPDVFDLTPSARTRLGAILRDIPDNPDAVDTWAKRVNWTRTTQQRTLTAYDDLPATLLRARWAPQAKNSEDGDSEREAQEVTAQ